GPGFPHFALYVPTDEFDTTIEAVRAAGVKTLGDPSSRVDFGTPVRAAFITDPSGNVIELTDVGPLGRTSTARTSPSLRYRCVAFIEPHPDGLGTAGTVDRPLLGRRDADELPPLDPEDRAAAADLPAPDVGRAEHAVGREVVDLGRFLEEPGAGEAVVAV